MFKKVYLNLQLEQKTTVIILSVLILFGVIKAGYYTVHYGGVDLRQRVVGARLINTDNSAYFYKWSPGDPEKFIDPNVRKGVDINGVTVAPGALYFQSLFSFLKYPVLRMVWTIVQYLLIISIFYFFLFKKDIAAINKFAIVIIGGIFFLCSPVWFINIERGQIYILYAFLFTSIFFLYISKSEYSKYISGILISIAIYCRPTFIVLIIPILFNYKKSVIYGFGSAGVPLLLHAFYHQQLWKDYFKAVGTFTGMRKIIVPASLPHGILFPKVVEGASNLSLYKSDFICGGISPLNTWIEPMAKNLSGYFYIFCYVIVVALISIILRKKLNKNSSAQLIIFAFLLYITSEYIMPAPRGAYNLIQWIFPVLLFLQRPRCRPEYTVLLIAGLCFINAYPLYFPLIHNLGELLLVICLSKYIWDYKVEKANPSPH